MHQNFVQFQVNMKTPAVSRDLSEQLSISTASVVLTPDPQLTRSCFQHVSAVSSFGLVCWAGGAPGVGGGGGQRVEVKGRRCLLGKVSSSAERQGDCGWARKSTVEHSNKHFDQIR